MMKSDKDNLEMFIDSELDLNEDFNCIEQLLSKNDNEYNNIKFLSSFDNSLKFNHDITDIKEDMNDDINYKKYFIDNKVDADIQNSFNQNIIKKINNLSSTINKENNNTVLEIILLGKKMTGSQNIIEHNKYTFDNVLRKIKNLSLKSYLHFLNNKIKEKYKNSYINWKLYVLNHSQAANSNIEFNRDSFDTTLKEIFSDDVSTKCKTQKRFQNKIVIQKLLNEKDEEKRNYFEKILNCKFIDIVKYLRGDKEGLDELEGLQYHEKTWNKIRENKNFSEYFIINMANIEKLLYIKKPRNGKKKKMEK